MSCLTLKLRSHGHMVQKWFRIEISEMAGQIDVKLCRRIAGTIALNLFHKNFGKIYYRRWLAKFENVIFLTYLQNSISVHWMSTKLRPAYSTMKLYSRTCQLFLYYRPLRDFASEPIAGLRNFSLFYTISLHRAINRCAIGPAFYLGTFVMVQGRV